MRRSSRRTREESAGEQGEKRGSLSMGVCARPVGPASAPEPVAGGAGGPSLATEPLPRARERNSVREDRWRGEQGSSRHAPDTGIVTDTCYYVLPVTLLVILSIY